MEPIQTVADLIINAHKIVIFTGAGVSTESGIPDFRSPGGIWTKYDPKDKSATFRVLVNPLIVWIWVGGGFLLAGGAFAFSSREKSLPGVVG